MPRIILVVEDDDILRMHAAFMFEDAGMRVAEVGSADEASAFLHEKAEDVGLIFTDVQMPGEMDGVDLAHHVVASWPWIKILVTSGRAVRELPCDVHFMPKPWIADAVLTHVRRHL